MTRRIGPTLAIKLLGRALAEERARAGMKPAEVAAQLKCSVQKVQAVEAGRNNVNLSELRHLGEIYKTSDELLRDMEEMREAAKLPRWWTTYKPPRWLADYIGLEDAAKRVREMHLEVIPGLLQIPPYVQATQVILRPEDRDTAMRTVAIRLERQARLTAERDPLELDVVISEASLHRALHQPGVGLAQIEHLVHMAERGNVTIRIIPFKAGLHASMAGSFTLLEFDDDIPTMGYQEYAVGGHIVDDRAAVEQMLIIWEQLCAQALNPSESLRFLAELTSGGEAAHGSVGVAQV